MGGCDGVATVSFGRGARCRGWEPLCGLSAHLLMVVRDGGLAAGEVSLSQDLKCGFWHAYRRHHSRQVACGLNIDPGGVES